MLTKDDIFAVQASNEMILKGVTYAQKSLHYTYNRMGLKNHYARVRNIVKGIIMESAFRKLLDAHRVEYELLGATHWTKKDRYDVGFRGSRHDIKGFFIGDGDKAAAVRKDKGWLLDCSALVPSDQLLSRTLKDRDVYVFAFLLGREIAEISDLDDLFSPSLEAHLVHTFWDYSWLKNPEWRSLGKLRVKSGARGKVSLRIGGQAEDKELVVENLVLKPFGQLETRTEFFTVLFAQANTVPSGKLHIRSPVIEMTEEISSYDWGNIWIYDAVVYLTGYMSKGEFKTRSKKLPRFSRCKQYEDTKTNNNELLIQELHSLRDLLPTDVVNTYV